MAQRMTITHGLAPVFDERSKVLVLGTMPSPKSREVGFYYGHPQNRFWKILSALFAGPIPEDIEGKRTWLLEHRIALWDVLSSCSIEGASDASIEEAEANDLGFIFEAAPIAQVFCTGASAYKYYSELCEPSVGRVAIKLPSPSAANASWSLERLVDAYQPIKQVLQGDWN